MWIKLRPKNWEKKTLWEIVETVKHQSFGSEYKWKEGKIPIIDQSKQWIYGYHNIEEKEQENEQWKKNKSVKILKLSKLDKWDYWYVTFANHTANIRFITNDFSTIQNVFVIKRKKDNEWKYLIYNNKLLYYLLIRAKYNFF